MVKGRPGLQVSETTTVWAGRAIFSLVFFFSMQLKCYLYLGPQIIL